MKAKTGIFCFLIHEVRPATDLEMPLGDNVFVIKVCTCAARFVTGRLGGGGKRTFIELGTPNILLTVTLRIVHVYMHFLHSFIFECASFKNGLRKRIK